MILPLNHQTSQATSLYIARHLINFDKKTYKKIMIIF